MNSPPECGLGSNLAESRMPSTQWYEETGSTRYPENTGSKARRTIPGMKANKIRPRFRPNSNFIIAEKKNALLQPRTFPSAIVK
jgi:hypothetical protein